MCATDRSQESGARVGVGAPAQRMREPYIGKGICIVVACLRGARAWTPEGRFEPGPTPGGGNVSEAAGGAEITPLT